MQELLTLSQQGIEQLFEAQRAALAEAGVSFAGAASS